MRRHGGDQDRARTPKEVRKLIDARIAQGIADAVARVVNKGYMTEILREFDRKILDRVCFASFGMSHDELFKQSSYDFRETLRKNAKRSDDEEKPPPPLVAFAHTIEATVDVYATRFLESNRAEIEAHIFSPRNKAALMRTFNAAYKQRFEELLAERAVELAELHAQDVIEDVLSGPIKKYLEGILDGEGSTIGGQDLKEYLANTRSNDDLRYVKIPFCGFW